MLDAIESPRHALRRQPRDDSSSYQDSQVPCPRSSSCCSALSLELLESEPVRPFPSTVQDPQEDDDFVLNAVGHQEGRVGDDELLHSFDAARTAHPGMPLQRSAAFEDASSNSGSGSRPIPCDVTPEINQIVQRLV